MRRTVLTTALLAACSLTPVVRADDERPPELERAEDLLLKGRQDRALASLKRYVEAHPKDARGHRELGFVLLLMHRAADALVPLRRACALAPDDVEAHLTLARAFERLKRFDEAIKVYEHAVTIGPKISTSWRSLARLLVARNVGDDRKRAREVLRQASKHNPKDEQVALDHAGLLLESEDPADHARARQVLVSFLIQVPWSVRAARFLAQVEAAQGQLKRASRGRAPQAQGPAGAAA